jgi:hypothetical protein
MSAPKRSLYFENGIGRIWEEPGGYLRLEYLSGPREAVQFRALLTHTASALSRRQWSKILVDQREMAPYSPIEQDWMTNEWLPRAVQDHGYRHGAILVAHNVFARLVTNQYMMASRGLQHSYRTFETEDDAAAWLREQGLK